MSTIIEFLKSNSKILVEIALCKLGEGFFVLCGAITLVKFIIAPSNQLLLATFALFAGRFILSSRSEIFFARLSIKIQSYFRNAIHERIFTSQTQSGELLTLIFDTLQALDDFFIKVAPNIASAVIFLPIFLVCAAFTDFLSAIILILTFPVAPTLLWLIGKATAEKNAKAWAEIQNLNKNFRELLSAITTLKIFNKIDAGALKIRESSQKSSSATLEVLKFAFISSFALELITTLSIALVAVTFGLRLLENAVDFQAALFLLLISPEFFLPIRKFGVAFHVIIAAKASIERLDNFLIKSHEIAGSVEKILIPPSISLVNLSFSYKKSPVFSNLSLKFPAGKITALIGDSGAGKSTILKLLAGVLSPNEGEIFWNELPISQMEKISQLSKVSYVPQAPHLFKTSLINNFTMFDALDSDNLKILLAELNLPLDLAQNQQLSRGQLQRLGLIRALLKNSPIILLDEPTAGLDELTEQKVINLIKKIAPRRTIIIATHRLAVISAADEIIQL